MGYAKSWMIELEEKQRAAHERMPENLDIALTEISDLRDKVVTLEARVAAQNSIRERYKDYVIGGIIGAIISLVLTALL